MKAADIAAVLALWRSTEELVLRVESDNEPSLIRFLERNPGLSYVAETDSRIIGNVLCGHDGRRGYLYHLAVAPQYRRAGCASALLLSSQKSLVTQGITRCHAFILSQNQTAKKFWASVKADQRPDLCIVTMFLEGVHRYPDPRRLKVSSYL